MKEPRAFDTLSAATFCAARYEDRVNAVMDYIIRDEGKLASLPQVFQSEIEPGRTFHGKVVEGWEVSYPEDSSFFFRGKRCDLVTISFDDGNQEEAILVREG